MQPVNLQKRAIALKSNLNKRRQLKLLQSNKTSTITSLFSTIVSNSELEEKITIRGGNPLIGSVTIMGAKNAALPILCASILANKPVILSNVPHLSDVEVIAKILSGLTCDVTLLKDHKIQIVPNTKANTNANNPLCATMRASILVLGPLLAKYGKASVLMPGGCSIGARPVDLHITALEKLGATIEIKENVVFAEAKEGLVGAEIEFPIVSVGATENIVMAASYAKGTTILKNCALEPEIADLCNYLVSLGANISGIGTATLTIVGDKNLGGGNYSIIADRIEAASYIALALATKGKITLNNISKNIFGNLLDYFKNIGGKVEFINDTTLLAEYVEPLQAINIATAPYPYFPTDVQSQFMVLLALAKGTSTIHETIFEDRFKHAAELNKIGANIIIDKSVAKITGVKEFYGTTDLIATDLRASFALIMAALCNKDTCSIIKLQYLDRGYFNVVNNLKLLGADINRGVGV